jgi:hypothetical protein
MMTAKIMTKIIDKAKNSESGYRAALNALPEPLKSFMTGKFNHPTKDKK